MADGPHDSILGLSTTDLAGLTAEELTGNPTAIKMMLHYYKKLVDDNAGLKNDVNTFRTYAAAYQRAKDDSTMSTALFLLGNIASGYGINLLTASGLSFAGLGGVAIGVVMSGCGIYFNRRHSSGGA